MDDYRGVQAAITSGLACAPWPTKTPCVGRTNETLVILPGWGLSAHAQALYSAAGGLELGTKQQISLDLSTISLYRCGSGENALNCGGALSAGGTHRPTNGTTSPKSSICNKGSHGPLCAVCDEGWAGGTDDVCSVCGGAGDINRQRVASEESISDEVKLLIIGLLIMAAIAVLIPLLRTYYNKISPLLGLLLKHHRMLLALKNKANMMGLEQSGSDHVGGEGGDELGNRLKIFVSNFQILAMIPAVLNFSFAEFCPAFASFTSWFNWLSFDLFATLAVDCVWQPSLYGKFIFVQSLPIVLIAIVKIAERLKLRQVTKPAEVLHAKATTLSRILLILFLLYPTVSASVFNMFLRRQLDHGECMHRLDASIDCNFEGEYLCFVILALGFMLLYPIGIPLSFGILLFKNRDKLSRDYSSELDFDSFKQLASIMDPNQKWTDAELTKKFDSIDKDGTKVISIEELGRFSMVEVLGTGDKIDEISTARPLKRAVLALHGVGALVPSSATENVTTVQSIHVEALPWWRCGDGEKGREKFYFLTKAFEPQYFWFELVEYARKLLLLGILLFANQGSISQMYLALAIAFIVVLLTTRTMPYKNLQTDRYKAAMDVNLFFTISCALMLKLNLAGEWLTDEFFDGCMTASNAIVGLIPAVWAVYHSVALMITNVQKVLDNLQGAMPEEKLSRCQIFKKLVFANKKEIMKLFKLLRKTLADDDGDESDSEADSEAGYGGEDGFAGTDAALNMLVNELRPILEPALVELGLSWDEKRVQESIADPEELQSALDDPVAFIQSLVGLEDSFSSTSMEACFQQLAAAAGPVAIRLAIAKLRPKMEPLLAKQSLTWAAVLPALELIDTLSEVEAAISDPGAFLQRMPRTAEPPAPPRKPARLQAPPAVPPRPQAGNPPGSLTHCSSGSHAYTFLMLTLKPHRIRLE